MDTVYIFCDWNRIMTAGAWMGGSKDACIGMWLFAEPRSGSLYSNDSVYTLRYYIIYIPIIYQLM